MADDGMRSPDKLWTFLANYKGKEIEVIAHNADEALPLVQDAFGVSRRTIKSILIRYKDRDFRIDAANYLKNKQVILRDE